VTPVAGQLKPSVPQPPKEREFIDAVPKGVEAAHEPTAGREPAPASVNLACSRPRRLSEEMAGLIAAFAERPVTLREGIVVLHQRAYTLLLILLALPFCTPIPLPGISTPFGLVIAVIGFRLSLGQKPWLPARLLDTTLPAKFFPRVLAATRRLVCWLEVFLKPRFSNVLRWRIVGQALGAMFLVCGLLLMLPLPVPVSNALPAITIVLLAAAMLEEDGHFAVAGAGMFLLTLSFFAAIFWGGAEAVNFFRETFGGAFKPDDESVLPTD